MAAAAALGPVDDDGGAGGNGAGGAGGAGAAGGASGVPPADEVVNKPIVKSKWDKTPRNAPCPCGSGKKFKMCHGAN